LQLDAVEISVADTGIGIREADMPKLFQPFQQIESGLSRKYEGTGLGLSICQRLLVLLGGRMTVVSEFGRGSRFAFTVPLQGGCPDE
jgi:signal transduction histidine kinase